MRCEVISVITDPSFLGALIGAVITGIIAIVVFYLGNNATDKKKEKTITNYVNIIQELHDKTNNDFKKLCAAIKEDESLGNYQMLVSQLIVRGKILDLVDVTELIKVTEKTFYVTEYIVTYREAINNISILENKFGKLQYSYIHAEHGKSNIEWLEYYIQNMEKALEKIK